MSTISAGTTTTTALVQTGDTTGSLVLQTGSTPTTAMTISSSQIVNFANAPTVGGAPLPSGAMTLISTLTANNTATSLSWTGLTAGITYLIIFNGVKPLTNSALFLRSGSSGTYNTSGYLYQGVASQGTTTTSFTNTLSGFDFTGGQSNVANYSYGYQGISGYVYITPCYASYANVSFSGTAQFGANSYIYQTQISGFGVGNTQYQLVFSNGTNIYSGTASLYGISS